MTPNKQQMDKETKSPSPGRASRPPTTWKPAKDALADIEDTFGFMPEFVNTIPEQAIPGAWGVAKNIYFNPHTALEPKLKSLIGLSVATQIPCDMMTYFEKSSSELNRATEQELAEAVMIAAMTRHWSSVINGSMIDRQEFKKETDQIVAYVKKMMDQSGGQPPPPETFLVNFATPAETYKDIEKTLGLVPKFLLSFPEGGIAAAWSEFKGFQLNPHTALNGKQKELIGLAVSSQIPCEFCIYFHRTAAKLNGATDKELQEAVAIGAISRHWSAVFHGSQIGLERFQHNADRMIENVGGRQGPLSS